MTSFSSIKAPPEFALVHSRESWEEVSICSGVTLKWNGATLHMLTSPRGFSEPSRLQLGLLASLGRQAVQSRRAFGPSLGVLTLDEEVPQVESASGYPGFPGDDVCHAAVQLSAFGAKEHDHEASGHFAKWFGQV
jgi:hypothetical protein